MKIDYQLVHRSLLSSPKHWTLEMRLSCLFFATKNGEVSLLKQCLEEGLSPTEISASLAAAVFREIPVLLAKIIVQLLYDHADDHAWERETKGSCIVLNNKQIELIKHRWNGPAENYNKLVLAIAAIIAKRGSCCDGGHDEGLQKQINKKRKASDLCKDDDQMKESQAIIQQRPADIRKQILFVIQCSEDDQGMTALMYASMKGEVECVRLLIEAGADFERRDDYGLDPLIYAAKGGHVGCVRLLIELGASPNAEYYIDESPLFLASERRNVECVRLLIAANAKLDFRVDELNGFTALMQACEKGHVECVRLLVKAGAALDIRDNEGKTATGMLQLQIVTAMQPTLMSVF